MCYNTRKRENEEKNLKTIKEQYRLKDFSYKKLDMFLWRYGKSEEFKTLRDEVYKKIVKHL